jgi:hypothetical protein
LEHTRPLPSIATVRERLIARRRVALSGCWVLNGNCRNESYTNLTIEGVMLRVHQWSAYVWHGHKLRAGYTVVVRHHCDNPPCFNPEHLIPGTYRENALDAIERGQWLPLEECSNGHAYTPENTYVRPDGIRKCRICMNATKRRHEARTRAGKDAGPRPDRAAESNGNHKLTWEQVRRIREERAAGVSIRVITERYGIGKSQAYNITSGKLWLEPGEQVA